MNKPKRNHFQPNTRIWPTIPIICVGHLLPPLQTGSTSTTLGGSSPRPFGGALLPTKMESRLVASIYLFRAGSCRKNACKMSSMFSHFDCRHIQKTSSFQNQGFESSSRYLHSYDDFSELGPQISECSAKQIKLVTEKPDVFVKTHPSKRRPVSSDMKPRVQDIVATMTKANHASRSTSDSNKISDIGSSGSVSVTNILPTVGLLELVGAISEFGKVSGASFVAASNGLRCCNIKFEDVDSSRRAILSGKIAVGSHVFPVHSDDAVDLVAIRIKNINRETSDFAIHSKCKSLGEFVGLARNSKDAVDDLFNVRDDKTHLKIPKKLNNSVLDHNQWSADVLEVKHNSSETSSDEEDRYKLGLQILDHISKLKKNLIVQKVYLEDLETLNASIIHIEGLRSDLLGCSE